METLMRILVLALILLVGAPSATSAAEPVAPSNVERAMNRGPTRNDDPTRALQMRLRQAVAKGVPLESYPIALAQAWLDYSREAYFRKDRRASTEALQEAHDVMESVERSGADAQVSARIIPSSSRLRDDLWQRAANFKAHDQFPCGAWQTARLEVALVAAGRANNDFGWRAARPFIQRAERYARVADAKIAACAEPKPAQGNAPAKTDEITAPAKEDSVVSPPVKPGEKPAALNLPDRVHFAGDSAELSEVSALVLEQVSYVMRASPVIVIDLQGYADELPNAAENEKLATARAQAVRDYLLETGIGRERLNVLSGKSESGENKAGQARAKLRRVELIPTQSDRVPTEYQDKDLRTEGPQG